MRDRWDYEAIVIDVTKQNTARGRYDRPTRWRFPLQRSTFSGQHPSGHVTPSQISFLHIDLNSAEPERLALEHLFPCVSPGGVMELDDYGWVLHAKQKSSADRFMNEHGHTVLELPTG